MGGGMFGGDAMHAGGVLRNDKAVGCDQKLLGRHGFAAGVGLITMLSLGIVLMSKSVIKLPL